jgi:hypothetical protein
MPAWHVPIMVRHAGQETYLRLLDGRVSLADGEGKGGADTAAGLQGTLEGFHRDLWGPLGTDRRPPLGAGIDDGDAEHIFL